MQYIYHSPIGALYIIATDKHLLGIYHSKQNYKVTKSPNSIMLETCKQLTEYFDGSRKKFNLKLHFSGTEFQKSVWKNLMKIPYGVTISYSELAKNLAKPNATRAVGSANGKNPFSIIIPCHRVIAKDGSLGGYNGGLKRKTMLLEKEGLSPF